MPVRGSSGGQAETCATRRADGTHQWGGKGVASVGCPELYVVLVYKKRQAGPADPDEDEVFAYLSYGWCAVNARWDSPWHWTAGRWRPGAHPASGACRTSRWPAVGKLQCILYLPISGRYEYILPTRKHARARPAPGPAMLPMHALSIRTRSMQPCRPWKDPIYST